MRHGHARRQINDAVLDVTILRNHHRQRLGRLELDELDMLQGGFALGRQHQTGAARQAGEHLAGLGQHVFERGAAACSFHLRLDDPALFVGQIANLHEGIDEKAQPLLRRQPAGRDMRRVDEAEVLQIAHHVAHRRRRQRLREHARQTSRA